ncbi:MAG: hypothetical protein ABII64_02875 [Elusimicrobiota bacterium]
MNKVADQILITFYPEGWGELDKFARFYMATHKDIPLYARKAISGTLHHFQRAHILLNYADNNAKAILKKDNKELSEKHFTNAIGSKELSALIEAIILDAYSALSCTSKVICTIYKKGQGVTDSTHKLFNNAINNKIHKIPDEIIEILRKSFNWYEEYRILRDEISHSDIGTCHMDKASGRIFYLHTGLGTATRAKVIDDIFQYLEDKLDNINALLGGIYRSMNSTLGSERIRMMCGFFNNRMYFRSVSCTEAKNINSGECLSREQFDNGKLPICPLKDKCGAYSK